MDQERNYRIQGRIATGDACLQQTQSEVSKVTRGCFYFLESVIMHKQE